MAGRDSKREAGIDAVSAADAATKHDSMQEDTETDHKLKNHFREESDEMLFSNMEFSEAAKRRVRIQAAAEIRAQPRASFRKRWIAGIAAVLVAGVIAVAGLPLLQQDAPPLATEPPLTTVPGGGGTGGSDLTELVTTPVATAEKAQSLFGGKVLVPDAAPEGFVLEEIAAVGMQGEPIRDLIFTYAAGERSLTFTASRMPTAFPTEMFSSISVNGVKGHVFEQPKMVELFWTADGVHYGITGSMTAEQASAFAVSLK